MSDFWTRRKSAVEAEDRARDAALAHADARARDKELAERPDDELLAEAGMPDPDTLVDSAQVRAFLKSALPERLKTRALRRLWRMNPVLANLDGLVDYDADYTDAALAVKDLKTSYQVGRGMLRAIEAREMAEAQSAEPADVSPEDEVTVQVRAGEDALQPSAKNCLETEADAVPAPEPGPCTPNPSPALTHEQIAPSARRMAFSFDEGTT